tara:strand:- start:2554 stop:2865 length:312 start_codon:yes stop_codon:yes gene_type:complete
MVQFPPRKAAPGWLLREQWMRRLLAENLWYHSNGRLPGEWGPVWAVDLSTIYDAGVIEGHLTSLGIAGERRGADFVASELSHADLLQALHERKFLARLKFFGT